MCGGQCSGQTPASHPRPLSNSTPSHPPARPDPLPPKSHQLPCCSRHSVNLHPRLSHWTAGGHSRASQWPDQAWLACVLSPDSVSSLLSHHVAHSPGDPRPGPASASPHRLCPLATASSFRPNSVAGETFLTRPGGTSPRPPRPGVSVSSWVFLPSWLLSLVYLLHLLLLKASSSEQVLWVVPRPSKGYVHALPPGN